MLSGAGTRGHIVVDAGAAQALSGQGRSLLPAGVSVVQGDFGRGDLVKLYNDVGEHIGSGLTNYSSSELIKIKGARSSELEKLLGYRYGDEVVHRNDLVMVEPMAEPC